MNKIKHNQTTFLPSHILNLKFWITCPQTTITFKLRLNALNSQKIELGKMKINKNLVNIVITKTNFKAVASSKYLLCNV